MLKSTKNNSGTVIIVTGGSRGIGAQVCRKAATAGFRIAFSYLSNQAAADSLAEEISTAGSTCTAVQGDVSSEHDVIALFDAASDLGTLHGLVNNAGILETQMQLADMTVERFDRIMATNVRGCFLCAREAVRRMAKSRGGVGGAIVNVSSRAAPLGSPNEYVDYAMSKGAIDSLTIGLSKEVGGDGIRVNAVRPGIIETEIHASGGEPGRVSRVGPNVPLGRGGTATEVADAIVWLLSDEASYCSGALLDVSGGR